MADPIRSLLAEMADELDNNRQCLMGDSSLVHPLAERARAALAAAPPAPAPTINDLLELCEDHEFHLGIDGANEEESAEGLLQIIRVALSRWGNQPPAPAEPDTDAVLTLAAIIRQAAGNGLPGAARLAELILSHPDAASVFQPPAPAPATDGEREELADRLGWIAAQLADIGWRNDSTSVGRAAVLLQQPAPAPVPVADRPWEREGWCADWGWCWVFVQGQWVRDYPQNYPDGVFLPHWAIPQPPQGEEVAE
jgi:hypothetical protein